MKKKKTNITNDKSNFISLLGILILMKFYGQELLRQNNSKVIFLIFLIFLQPSIFCFCSAFNVSFWDDVWKFNVNVLPSYPCNSIVSMPSEYYDALTHYLDADTKSRFDLWRKASSCGSQTDTDIPCSSWKRVNDLVPSITTTQQTEAPNTTTATPLTSPPQHSQYLTKRNIIIGCTIGGAVVLAVVALIIVVVLRKRRLATIQYTPLNSVVDVDMGSEW